LPTTLVGKKPSGNIRLRCTAVHPDAACRRKGGFSLVEILVVIAIIALLLGMIGAAASLVYRAAASLDFEVSSSGVGGGVIAVKYTADGQDISPPLSWTVTASKTRSIVVVLLDYSVQRGTQPTCDWIVYNLPPGFGGLPEGFNAGAAGGMLGRNDLGVVGYTGPGPAPKSGAAQHRYVFDVYTLDTILNVGAAPSYSAIQANMNGHVLQGGSLRGIYP
jgi:Raf kinase inhibitor-like YbhB/YbcL family protein